LIRHLEALKKILKKIFPTPFLKEVFLIYNRVRIHTVDKLLFPECKVLPAEFLLYRKGHPFRENNVAIDALGDPVKKYMNQWYDWTQEEFILFFDRPCVIEPDYGWAIVGPNKLLFYSLGLSRTLFQRKPDILKWLRKKKIAHFPTVISLRDTGEENYFHFYNDVLSKLFFLISHNIDVTSIPVVISKKLWDKEYFRFYFAQSSFMRSIKWVVQDENFVACKSLIVCKPLTHRIDLWHEMIRSIKPIARRGHRRIFVTRKRARLRFIENESEIVNLCQRLGLEVIDPGDLSPDKQIETFFNAEIVVGIHGAGLTNIAFCDANCLLLEIFPPPTEGYLPFHYIMLASMQRVTYGALIGSPSKEKYSGGFTVDILELEKQVTLLLNKLTRNLEM
jgi:hypothetical protein